MNSETIPRTMPLNRDKASLFALFLVCLSISTLTGFEVINVIATPAPSRSTSIEPGWSGYCTDMVYVDGTTPVDHPTNGGVNTVGTAGQDLGAFLNTILAANKADCIEAGTYTFTTKITWTANYVHLIGEPGAILKLGTGGTTLLGIGDGVANPWYATVRDFTFDCNSQANSIGMQLKTVYRSQFYNLQFLNCSSIGVDIQGPSYDNVYQNFYIEGLGIGMKINSNANSNGVRVSTWISITTRLVSNPLILTDYVNNNQFNMLDLESANLIAGLRLGNQSTNNQVYQNAFDTVDIEGPATAFGVIFGASVGGQTGVDKNVIRNAIITVNVVNRVTDNSGKTLNKIVDSEITCLSSNQGTATISAATSVSVTHGLTCTTNATATPTFCTATPFTTAYAGGVYWIHDIGNQFFTIQVTSSGTWVFYWYCSQYPR